MKSQQYSIYHVNKMTSLCDMCTKTIDVNFGATVLMLTLGEWRLDCGLWTQAICVILHITSAKCQ